MQEQCDISGNNCSTVMWEPTALTPRSRSAVQKNQSCRFVALSAVAVDVKHEGAARHSVNELQPEQHLDNDQNGLGTMGRPRAHSVSFSACHSKFPELWAPMHPATATQEFSAGTSPGVLVSSCASAA